MDELLALARALGDENRLRALLALETGELCLCELIEVLGLAPSTVSRHMSLLERAGLVARRKQGRWQYFRLPGAVQASLAGKALGWALEGLHASPNSDRLAARVERARRVGKEELCRRYREAAPLEPEEPKHGS